MNKYFLGIIVSMVIIVFSVSFLALNNYKSQQKINLNLIDKLEKNQRELKDLKNQDQYKINIALEREIKNVKDTYGRSVTSFEKIQDLKAQKQNTDELDKLFAEALKYLSEVNYASAESTLESLESTITKKTSELNAIAVTFNIPFSNTPPTNGYSRQSVKTDAGDFLIDIVSTDLNSTRVIADTASDSGCSNNCVTLPLSDYVSRNNAYAGINGTFFCPAEYPSCAGKTNSFDTLLMNKNKKYFNSDNNVYSVVPAVIFKDNWVRFVEKSLEWGRDTSVDSVIAMQPLLVFNKNVVYSGSDNAKFNGRGTRSFIANKGNTAYIGVIRSATMGESAKVLNTLGMENALNLDEGGSTALWYQGYKAGPGRNIPNAILFIRK